MAKLVQLTGRLTNHLVRPTRLLAGHTSRASSDICNMAGGYHCKQSVRCMSRIIKKRITRIPSDTVVHQEEVDDYQHGPNDVVPLELVNRNPRNLEQLCVECKPLGFELDLPSRNFWNKLVFEKTGKYLTAKVIHHTGRVLLSASTQEEAYRAHSDSVADTQAAKNIGTILARRCIEAGILYVDKETVGLEDATRRSAKVSAFVDALRAEGLKLNEPDMIFPRRSRDL